MNQYPAPLPGHFMWHLFSIPLWAQRAGWVPPHHSQSPSTSTEVCNLHWGSSHLSLTERSFVFPFQEFGILTGARRGEKKQLFAAALQKSCRALFNQLSHPVVIFKLSCKNYTAIFFPHLSTCLNASPLVIWVQFCSAPILDIDAPEGSH